MLINDMSCHYKYRLPSLPPFDHCKDHILEIYGAKNLITALPDNIGDWTQLKTFDLAENKLQALPPSVSKLVSLKTLLLGKNYLHSLPSEFSEMYV